MRLEDKSCARI